MGMPDMRPSDQRRSQQAPARSSGWRRLALTVLFVMVLNLLHGITVLLAVVQLLLAWFAGGADPRLRRFGHSLADYARHLVRYLAYDCESAPFPFSDWPLSAEQTKEH